MEKRLREKRKEKERNAPLRGGLTNDREKIEGNPKVEKRTLLLLLPFSTWGDEEESTR